MLGNPLPWNCFSHRALHLAMVECILSCYGESFKMGTNCYSITIVLVLCFNPIPLSEINYNIVVINDSVSIVSSNICIGEN